MIGILNRDPEQFLEEQIRDYVIENGTKEILELLAYLTPPKGN